jgi:hypothetical protein
MRTPIFELSLLTIAVCAITACGSTAATDGGLIGPAQDAGATDRGSVGNDSGGSTGQDSGAQQGQDAAAPGQDASSGQDATAGQDTGPGQDAAPGQDATPGGMDADLSDTGPHPTPGVCFPDPQSTGNSIHIGAYCTKGGGECNQYGLTCAIDVDSRGGNFCIKIFCGATSECGDEACCFSNPGDIAKACIPLGCVATDAGVCPM